MKKSILVFVTLFLTIQHLTFAQCLMVEVPLTQRIEGAEVIIEGHVVSKESYWNKSKSMIYTSYEIEVYKLFKGYTPERKAYLVCEGGQVDNEMIKVTPGVVFSVGERGLFFMNNKKGSYNHFTPYASKQCFIKYDPVSQSAVDPFKSYNNIDTEIYQLLSKLLVQKPVYIIPFSAAQYISGKQASRSVPPVITSFSPDTITAGTSSILTINGTNFGASYSGSADVYLRNADDGGATYYGISSLDVVSWSNTQVKILVFNRAGTGTFKIMNTGGELSDTSATPLIVMYNITQLSNDSIPDLVDDSLTGYVFEYNTSFNDSTAAVAAFERTIESWRCATYVNWMIADSTTTADTSGRDDINLVTYDNNDPLSVGVLGTAYSFYLSWGCGWYVNEVDIKFNDAPSGGWYYGVAPGGIGGSQSDFESVALHEMGHAHQIGHVIADGSLMHYALTSGTTSRVLDPNRDIAAGNLIMAKSVIANGCGPDPAMTPLNAGNCALCATISTSISKIDVACYGDSSGMATVTPSGGTTPYTYSWNTNPVQNTQTAAGIPAGTYIVTVTDSNGCTGADTVTITQSTMITNAITSTDVSCNGGSDGTATTIPSGGNPPYTYLWKSAPPQFTQTATGLISDTYTIVTTDSLGCDGTDSVIINQPAILLLSSTTTMPTCNGFADGSCTVSASGGIVPYSYLWSSVPPQMDTTAVGLAAGTYYVTVTDSNLCTKIDTVLLSQPTPVTSSTSVINNALCYGSSDGSALAIGSGGTLPYTYSWNTVPIQATDTASGLSAGKYLVTIKDSNSCSKLDSIQITEPNALADTIIKTDVTTCGGSDGTATVIPSGGVLPYSYLWSTSPPQTTDTAIGLTIGTFIVTITDSNSCTLVDSILLLDPSNVSVTITKTDVLCNGGADGTATATPSGGIAPYTFLWSTTPAQTDSTAIGLAAGNYTVTATDAKNCKNNNSATITEPAFLVLTTSSTAATSGSNGTATVSVSGGTTPYAYLWNTVPQQTSATATGLSPGSFIVTVTDNNDCSDTAHVIVSDISFALTNKPDEFITLYPNPVENNLFISFRISSNEPIDIELYHSLGIKLDKFIITKESGTFKLFDFNNYADGIYFVKAQVNDQILLKKMILIK